MKVREQFAQALAPHGSYSTAVQPAASKQPWGGKIGGERKKEKGQKEKEGVKTKLGRERERKIHRG